MTRLMYSLCVLCRLRDDVRRTAQEAMGRLYAGEVVEEGGTRLSTWEEQYSRQFDERSRQVKLWDWW